MNQAAGKVASINGRLYGLAPQIPINARVLVLGSFPSAASLASGRYYDHPRNHFWPIMAKLLKFPAEADYENRLRYLGESGIGLWDVYAACRRRGSLDQAIRDAAINDIAGLLASRPRVLHVFLNGGEAARAFALRLAPLFAERAWRLEGRPDRIGEIEKLSIGDGRLIACVRLPSTSPVPSARFKTMEAKLALWRLVVDSL